MTTRSIGRQGFGLGLGLALLGLASTAHATGPAGIWGTVSQVVYEPNAQTPTRVQIHGCFLFSSATPSTCQGGQGAYNYSCPESGYMYFECPAGDEALCKLQWSEIEASIGQAWCAGWGQFDQPKGTVRASSEPPANPDPYPLGMGVDTVGGTPCMVLEAQCAAKDGGAAGSAGTTGAGGSGGGAGGGAGTGSGGTGGSSTGGSTASGGSSGSGTGGSTAGSGSGDDSSGDDGGCALRAAGSSSGGSALVLLALGAALALSRRRA
jgi:hypothetical protein